MLTRVTPPISPAGRRQLFRERLAHYIASFLSFAVLLYVAFLLGYDTAPEQRVLLLRYWMLLGTATCAVAVPHVLLPDRRVPLMQLVNGSPGALQQLQASTWTFVPLAFVLSAAAIAFFDPGAMGRELGLKVAHFAESLVVLIGIGTYSLAYYTSLGATSQAWQEGNTGAFYRTIRKNSPQASLGVPDGLVPAITATARIFGLAIIVVGLGGYAATAIGSAAAGLPGALFCIFAGVKVARQRPRYDRHFYQTSAFYREVFRDDRSVYGGGQEPVAYEAVYWTPQRWRPHVWAGLRQLDRRLPLGRIVLIAHLLLWILFFQEASMTLITAYLVLFIAAKNAACFLLTRPELAPPGFQWSMQRPLDWAITRFFVNLRWTFPFLLSVLIVALFSARFSYVDALVWTGVDALAALVAAALVTMGAEGRHQRRFS